MAEQKKDKPQADVRDLKPTKDAKGGNTRAQSSTRSTQSGTRSNQ